MKSPFAVFQGRNALDTIGLFALLLLIMANAFHYNIYLDFRYYREIFGLLFLCLDILYFFSPKKHSGNGTSQLTKALKYLLVFPVMLALWSLFDPEIPLYGDYEINPISAGEQDLRLYVLRNALLYIPMVVYFYFRGLNLQELRLIALIAILISLFSINSYLQNRNINSITKIGLIAEESGISIDYNTYVPYLTFLILCGIFLISSKIGKVVRFIVIICIAINIIFCFLSTSRQSVLFIILTVGTFYYFSYKGKRSKGMLLNSLLLAVICIIFYLNVTKGYVLSDNFLNRFSSVNGFVTDESSKRVNAAREGFLLLNPVEWFTGAGLTCVINSGPHNDYVRWTQRVGIPLMILGFMPFLIAFSTCFSLIRMNRSNNTLFVFLILAIGFTLFHSFFCYPREEANQSLVSFLGLSMWFGAYREGLLKPSFKSHLIKSTPAEELPATINNPVSQQ